MRGEDLGLFVDRLAGLDHDHDRPRRPDRLGELGQRLARDEVGGEAAGIGDEGVGLLGGAVIDGDGIALLRHVEREIGAHDAKPDQTDIRHLRLPERVARVFVLCPIKGRGTIGEKGGRGKSGE